MRQLVPILIGISMLAGCADVHVRKGLPIVAKPQDGALIAGTDGAADIGRGNQARLAGRHDDAIRDLEPMAQRGYADAMLYLAAVYAQSPSMAAQDKAIAWYRKALPQRPEAVVPMARALTQSGQTRLVAEAEQLLLATRRRHDDPLADAALLNLYGLFPAFDTKQQAPKLAAALIKSPLPESRATAINWYRDEITDRASAERLLALCRKNLDAAPECYLDLVEYYRFTRDKAGLEKQVDAALKAFDTLTPLKVSDSLDAMPLDVAALAGRLAVTLVEQPGIEDTLEQAEAVRNTRTADELLRDGAADDSTDGSEAPDPTPQTAADAVPATPATVAIVPPSASGNAEPELANKVLRWMLKRPGAMKVEAAAVAVGFPYLLPDIDIEALLKAGVADQRPRASLMLGELYFFNQRAPREADLAEMHFKTALNYRETSIPAHYRLGRLYQQGYLSRPDPAKSLEHFLYAARHRVTAADTHLSRLFYDTPGARTNRVNAYVFAKLSSDGGYPVVVRTLRNGVPNAYPLLERLTADLTPAELEAAEALYQKERKVHLVTRRPIGPEVWAQETTAKPRS